MKTNLNNLSILFVGWLFLTIGCGGSPGGSDGDDPNARKTERGRLKFVISATSIHTKTRSIYRSVHSRFYVDGKEWSPEGEKDFAERFESCDTSPNRTVEILRCASGFGEEPRSTYILRMKNDQPEIKKIEAGNSSAWIDDDGRWLLFKKLYYNVETDERIEVKGMPFADDPYGSSPVQYVLGVSPDKKTVVTNFDSLPRTEIKNGKESAEKFLTLWIVDTEAGVVEKRKVSFTKNPWLIDHQQPFDDILPPSAAGKNFVWKRGADGRDKLVVPQLLEKVER